MSTAEGIVAQPTALEIARRRLDCAMDAINPPDEKVRQADTLVAIAAALIALAEQAGEISNALKRADASRNRGGGWSE